MQLLAAKNFLERCKSEDGIEQILFNVAKEAKDLEILSSYEYKSVRKKGKQQVDKKNDITEKETLTDPKQKFGVDCYFRHAHRIN